MDAAGLMGINNYTFQYRGYFKDANTANLSGTYLGLSPSTLANTPTKEYSLLICFNGANTYLAQFYITMNTWEFYRRFSPDNGGTWSTWEIIN